MQHMKQSSALFRKFNQNQGEKAALFVDLRKESKLQPFLGKPRRHCSRFDSVGCEKKLTRLKNLAK